MNSELIIRIVLLGIVHWVLAILLIQDLVSRKHVLGGRKWPWALAILLVTFLGSVVYLLCHPRVIIGGDRDEEP